MLLFFLNVFWIGAVLQQCPLVIVTIIVTIVLILIHCQCGHAPPPPPPPPLSNCVNIWFNKRIIVVSNKEVFSDDLPLFRVE